MSDLDETISLAESDQFDEVEDRWLSHLSDHSGDLDFFLRVADCLIEAGEQERAEFLLDLLEEQLKEIEDWQSLLDVLRKTGLASREPSELHEQALEALEKRYAGSPNLGAFVDKVGLLRAIEDTPKMWRKIDRLTGLMQFDVGAVVWMEGKGAGKVTEVNFDLGSFKLDLDQHSGLRVGFAAAPKILKSLPEGHFLRRKIEDPETLRVLAGSEPGEVLLALLQSSDKPLAAREVKLRLGSLVPSEKWAIWWTEARKHPQVLSSGPSSRQKYSWASSTDDAHDVIRQTFDSVDLEQKLAIYRKEARRSPELAEYMSARLAEQADSALEVDEAAALVIWNTLERNGRASALDWSPQTVLEEIENVASVITAIPDRALRERLYDIATEILAEWPVELARALKLEEDPRLLSSIAHRLLEHDRIVLESALEDLTGHPRRYASGFVWLVENAKQDALVENRNPLRLLRQVFDTFHQPEFAPFRNRLIKTLEGPATDSMLRRLDEDQARQALKAISRAPVEVHIRETLKRAIQHRYPSLDEEKESFLYATAQSIEARRKELKNLIEIEIPANRKAIEEARELGDLRENFEYKSARQRHEYLNARVEGLHRDLERVRPFDKTRIKTDEIRIGSKLVLRHREGKELVLTIMGPWESDPDQGIISYASDLGQNLLGLKVGDSVELEGDSYEVSSLDLG